MKFYLSSNMLDNFVNISGIKTKICNKCSCRKPNTTQYYYARQSRMDKICKCCILSNQRQKYHTDNEYRINKLINQKEYHARVDIKEKHRESLKLWYNNNRDTHLSNNRSYYLTNKETIKVKRKDYYNNPNVKLRAQLKWQSLYSNSLFRERRKESMKKYRLTETARSNEKKYRINKKIKDKLEIMAKLDNNCDHASLSPTILYINLHTDLLNNAKFIKIGITSRSIRERYSSLNYQNFPFITIRELYFKTRKEALAIEWLLLNNTRNYRYYFKDNCFGAGYSECRHTSCLHTLYEMDIFINSIQNVS